MIKKITDKDKKDWLKFVKKGERLENKDSFEENKIPTIKKKLIDLHGYSLDEANKAVYNFITSCYEENISKVKVITGKGSRSKNEENPYQSKNLSILKYSVPNYISSNKELLKIIKSFNQSEIDDISKGSFHIILKNKKN